MMISNPPSSKPSVSLPNWLVWAFLGASFFGVVDTGYLTANRFFGVPLNCTIVHGCDVVTTSSYSAILGIPVALLGLLYYVAIFFLCVWSLDQRRPDVMYAVAKLTWLGLAASVWFVSVQILVLKALCLYCLISAGTSTILFFLGLYTLRQSSKRL